MKSGNRDRLITVERQGSSTEDAFGAITESWATFTTAWAQVLYGRSEERRSSASERSEQIVQFRILANSTTLGITTADRVQFDGFTWDIESVTRLDRDGVELTCKTGKVT